MGVSMYEIRNCTDIFLNNVRYKFEGEPLLRLLQECFNYPTSSIRPFITACIPALISVCRLFLGTSNAWPRLETADVECRHAEADWLAGGPQR